MFSRFNKRSIQLLADAKIPVDVSDSRRLGLDSGLIDRLWSMISYPFQRSIHVRFRYAFVLAAFGLAVITVITFISHRILINTYELSVSEARWEMMPLQRLQEALREADDLVYHYAFVGDQFAPADFEKIVVSVESQFLELTENEARFASVQHAHSSSSLPDAVSAWREAQVAIVRVFQQKPGTVEAVQAVTAVHAAIDPVYETISGFHHLSMQDLQDRLKSAHSVVSRAMYAVFGAIVIGLGMLIGLGRILGRSILKPIAELREAAQKLAGKDFSHRVTLLNNRDELGQLGKAFNIAAGTIQRLYLELERRSTHDGLTDVLNRAAFDERLSEECRSADRHGSQLSLLMVDADFFKRVNDEFGHQAGDRVLQTIARTLSSEIRPGDVVARYGGEEFVIILPETDEDSAVAMAERLRMKIASVGVDWRDGETIHVTVSVGCACRQPQTVLPDELLSASDAALYLAKNAGRNRVVSAVARDLPNNTLRHQRP